MSMQAQASALVIAALIALPAAADSQIELQAGNAEKPDTLYVADGKVRMESAGQPGRSPKTVAIYDDERQVFTGLHKMQEIYVEMDEKALQKQSERASKARDKLRERMQAQMKKARPEQRELIKQRMEEMGLSEPSSEQNGAKAETKSKKTGRTDTVNGIECTEYQAYQGAQKTGTACIATREQLGIPKDDYQTLLGMYDFLHRLAEIAGPGPSATENFFADVDGIPVRLDSAEGNHMQLSEVKTESLPKDLFQVPEGYTRMTLAELDAARQQQQQQLQQRQQQQQQQQQRPPQQPRPQQPQQKPE